MIVEDFVRTRLFDPVDDPAIVAQVSAQMAKLPAHVFLSMAETVTSFDSAETRGSARCRRSSSSHDSRSSTRRIGDARRQLGFGARRRVRPLHPGARPDQVVAMIRRFLEMQLTR